MVLIKARRRVEPLTMRLALSCALRCRGVANCDHSVPKSRDRCQRDHSVPTSKDRWQCDRSVPTSKDTWQCDQSVPTSKDRCKASGVSTTRPTMAYCTVANNGQWLNQRALPATDVCAASFARHVSVTPAAVGLKVGDLLPLLMWMRRCQTVCMQ